MDNQFTNPVPIGTVPTGWKIQSVDFLCERVTSGGTPSRRKPEYYENGTIDWYKTQELNDGNLTPALERITDEALNNSSAKIYPQNTILMAMYGDGSTITSLGIVKHPSASNQACCAMIPDNERVDYRFLFYSLKAHRRDFIQLATGGAQRNLSGKLIKNFSIATPPIEEQRAIAHILGSLDDKIEANRRMNETLENTARAIFKSWFVDFDPVHAKANGEIPEGMSAETAELFPDAFQESALGLIPRGWEVVTIADVCENITSGGTPSTKVNEYWNGNIPWLSSGETRNSFITTTERTITQLGVEESSTKQIREFSTVIASAGQGHTRGQTSLLLIDSYINQSVVALMADNVIISASYLFFNLNRRYDEMRRLSDAHSSRGSLTTKLLAGMKLPKPSKSIIEHFDFVVLPMIEQIRYNIIQSATLAELRDTLLPRLISGELRVEDVSEFVGDV